MDAPVMHEDDTERWDEAGPPGAPPEREPPWSREAEQGVLGALLLDNAALSLVGDLLTPRSFYSGDHQLIYGALVALLTDRKPADIVTVYEWLSKSHDPDDYGGLQYLNQLVQGVPSAKACRRYAELVAERHIERQLIAGADEVAKIAWDGKVDLGERIERMVSVLSRVEQQRKSPGTRVPLMRLDALREAFGAITWLVKHVIPADSVGMLFGGSQTFKSFIAVDCALHVAHGLPWMGRITEPGPVLFLAAEGGAGLWKRIDAWHRQRRLRWQDIDMTVVPVALDLKQDAWRVVEACQVIAHTPKLVVIDTLSQTYSGEENSASDMAAYLRELGNRFRVLWGCTVIVIHHTGHQATERPRGSSAIMPNVDFLIGVHRDEKELMATVSCSKQKDGELFSDATFGMAVVQLGLDRDGDPITSLVARHLGTEKEVQEARALEAAAGRGGRTHALVQLVKHGMTEGELRRAFYAEVVADKDAEARKKAYQRARTEAIQAQLIEVENELVFLGRKAQP